jgi:hypothetical protein
MARLYSIIVELCWGLGVLSGVAAVLIKLVPSWSPMTNASPTGGLLLSSTLFLCALATREMEQRTK